MPNKASANPANPADIRRYYQWSDKLLDLDRDLARDLTVRRDTYLKPVEAIPGKYAPELGSDLSSYETNARAASGERNEVMEKTRSELTDKGRAFSESMKPEGKTYDQSLEEAFKKLGIKRSTATEEQLKAANELVIQKAGTSNVNVTDLAKRAADLERAQKVVGVANGMGKAAMVVGVAVDAYSLGTEINRSIETNSIDPALRESTRIAGGWTGAWAGAKAGAAGLGAVCAVGGSVVPVLGTATGGAVCAVIGGVGGGIGGYWAGSNAATKVYDAGKSAVNPEPRKP